MPSGWSLIVGQMQEQCRWWNLPVSDYQLLFDHMWELYDAQRKFLDLD